MQLICSRSTKQIYVEIRAGQHRYIQKQIYGLTLFYTGAGAKIPSSFFSR